MKLYGERYLGGAVSFTSTVQDGTRFVLTLPVLKPERECGVPEQADVLAGSRVILVDDDEALLRLGTLLMTRLGYSVTACRSGRDALALFEAEPDSFSAVITDWQMSGMHGMELVTRLRSVRDDIPVVVCSGFGEDKTLRDVIGVRNWLTKPYTFESLEDSLQNAIRGIIA